MALPTQRHSAPLEPGSPLQPLTRLPWKTGVVTNSVCLSCKGKALQRHHQERRSTVRWECRQASAGGLQRVPWNRYRGAQHTHRLDQAGQLLLQQPCRVREGCSRHTFTLQAKLEPPHIRPELEGHLPLIHWLSALAAHLEPLGCF